MIAILIAAISFSVNAQSVVITKRKVTYRRPHPQVKFKRTFVVNYPKVKAATPAISAAIERQLSYFKIFQFTLKEELNELSWLAEADFEVLHNANGILSVALTIDGSGAYPDRSTRNVNIDSRNGRKLMPPDLFRNLPALAAFADKKLQAEIDIAKTDIKNDRENSIDPNDLFEGRKFEVEALDEFWIQKGGVVFQYDYGFPHAIEALQPGGKIKFTWTELEPFIHPTGLLATFVR
jgi:hypothetical protein